MAKLSRKEIESVIRGVERDYKYRFQRKPTVLHGPKLDPMDLAHWESYEDERGRIKWFKIKLAHDEPKPVLKTVLRHELLEHMHQLRGVSPSKAHRLALKDEKTSLKRLYQKNPKRFGDSRGTPYVKLLWLRAKLLREERRKRRMHGKAHAKHKHTRASDAEKVRWWPW